jgi:1-acyl-sn-glycerol-3-phosphate acyltransferase
MSVWLPSAPCTPRACVEETGSHAAVPRAVLRLTAVALLVLAGVLLSPLGGRIPAGAVRRWSRAVVRAAGVRVLTTGVAAPAGGLLLVANHISWLDIPLLAAVRPARMLAKTEVRRWPVAGALAARGALFIDRDRLRALPGTVARIAGSLRAGQAVAVFPEGSTWCGRAQGHFRRAVFQAALDARVPVQPVRIRYRCAEGAASTTPAFVGDDSLLASLWRVATARGLVAEVEAGPVIAPENHPDRKSLAAAAGAWALGVPGAGSRETATETETCAPRRERQAHGVHGEHPACVSAAEPPTGAGREHPRAGAGHEVRPAGVSGGDRPAGARRGDRPADVSQGNLPDAGVPPQRSAAGPPPADSGAGAAQMATDVGAAPEPAHAGAARPVALLGSPRGAGAPAVRRATRPPAA